MMKDLDSRVQLLHIHTAKYTTLHSVKHNHKNKEREQGSFHVKKCWQ